MRENVRMFGHIRPYDFEKLLRAFRRRSLRLVESREIFLFSVLWRNITRKWIPWNIYKLKLNNMKVTG